MLRERGRELFDDFREMGVDLSPAARKYIAKLGLGPAPPDDAPPAAPGVVGLIYSRPAGPGFVTPLVARLAEDWYVAPNLPFDQAELREALTRLLQAAGTELADLHDEFFAFDVRDRAGFAPEGTSMLVAGLLAVLVAMAGDRTGRFRAACAVVEPGEGDALVPVAEESVAAKLDAFVREYEGGSLLVRPRHCPEVDPFARYFEEVWPVGSFGDLARHAERAGLLAAFRRKTPLNRLRFERARDRLHNQAEVHHRYQRVLPLARQLLEYPRTADVPPARVDDVRRLIYDLERHLGRYQEAVVSAAGEVRRLAHHPGPASYDEQARAAAALGSSLYDAHRFEEARDALAEWDERLRKDPALVSPLTRVMVWNTLGRIETIAGGDWEARFRAALALQQVTDPPDRARTYCYLAQGLLRRGRLPEAERVIREGQACPGANEFSRWVLNFARADLARRRGRKWSDRDMDRQAPVPGPAGHPLGIYLQATARQPGRRPEDRIARLHRAAGFFEIDVAGSNGRNLLSFLAACVRLRAAAEGQETAAWRARRGALGSYFRGRVHRGFAGRYRAAWEALDSTPDVGRAEALLDLVPYF